MQKLFLNLLLVLFFFNSAYPQNNIVDYNKLKSIVFPPSGMIFSPLGTNSTVYTSAEGFDNFYLGVDFGEPYIATNPTDPKNSITAYNINNIYCTIDGINWTKINASFPGYNVIGDPVVAFDATGNAYYVQLYQNTNYGIAIMKSTNKGLNWTSTYNVVTATVGLADKEWLTADRTNGPYSNNLYVVWRQFGASGMRYSRSTDFGQTWSTPMFYGGSQGAYVSVGANGSVSGGNVYIASSLGNYIAVYRSSDGGANFGTQIIAAGPFTGPGVICYGRYTVKGCIRTDNFPRMAADNSTTSTRGNVYIAYAANPGTSDHANIYVVRSTDYGSNWSSPVKVNDDNTTTDQWMPAISVDNNGRVFVSWYDSRVDVTNNLLTKLYGSISTNGGVSFGTNYPISDVAFNPDNMKVGQGSGEANYIGDYIGNSTTGSSSLSSWMDARFNNLASFVGYFPDFAMTVSNNNVNLNNGDSVSIIVKIPQVKGTFTERVKLTTSIDTLPASGTISAYFVNGKDSITTIPDSTILRIKATGSVTPKIYRLFLTGRGINGTPAHQRIITLALNSSYVTVGTNRNQTVSFIVNGNSYTTTTQFAFTNGSTVNIQAPSPQTFNSTQYVWQSWSNGGTQNQNITVNGNINLTAYYRAQFKLIMISSQGNTFGGNVFYDSGVTMQFGVTTRKVINGGTTYYFRGWTGAAPNSYTSTDSTGLDSAVTFSLQNPIVETARWTTWPNSVNQIGNEIPEKYDLYQNFPNPFNPNTTIKYDIIKKGIVRIMIYDILGKEVEVLVNELHDAGRYQVYFNASKYSSGIYYYKIQADDFTSVKKMILIK
jgi:hypothetical protein